MNKFFTLYIFAFILCICYSQVEETSKVKDKNDISERDLVTKKVNAKSIILEHKSYSMSNALVKNFPNSALGYVTPWNNHGYDIAKWFAKKFTYISPVWLQMRPVDGKLIISGKHNIDQGWIDDVKNVNPDVKIVPRIIFEHFGSIHIEKLNTKNNAQKVGKSMIDLAEKYRMDGYVFEIWNREVSRNKKDLHTFLIFIAEAFKKAGLSLILVIPPPFFIHPPTGQKMVSEFHAEDLYALAPYITAFSMMTYDYSASSSTPGPNSPLTWVQQCVDEVDPQAKYHSKLLAGLNMYGYKFTRQGPNPIVGSEYIQLLQKRNPAIKWNTAAQEHYIELHQDGDTSQIYYPSLFSIKQRLELARTIETGISLWEIGQGLDYFYELL